MMIADPDSARFFADFSGLAALKRRAASDRDAALGEAARQFEALFLQQMLRQMREAEKIEGGLFDSPALDQYRQMLDQQLALELSRAGGVGFARQIERQLSEPRVPQSPRQFLGVHGVTAARSAPAEGVVDVPAYDEGNPERFVQALLPLARKAAARLGVPAHRLVAQAALETGWGRHVLRLPDGRSSHNLFNIKADTAWSGERVRVPTLEYRDGVARRELAVFRAYAGPEQAFEDYVRLMRDDPRYAPVLAARDDEGWARALQESGYATDPAYAAKLVDILSRPLMQEARMIADNGTEGFGNEG